MNKKIYVFILLAASMNAFANGGATATPDPCKFSKPAPTRPDGMNATDWAAEMKAYNDEILMNQNACQRQNAQANANKPSNDGKGVGSGLECEKYMEQVDKAPDQNAKANLKNTASYTQCLHMMGMSLHIGKTEKIINYDPRSVQKQSMDGKVKCDKPFSYTADYEECEKALASYNFIVNSETFMNLTQTVRTDVKTSNINKEAVAQASNGDSQTAMFTAAEETNKHMKAIEAEKALAYSSAVAALTYAYRQIPNQDDAVDKCVRSKKGDGEDMGKFVREECKKTVEAHKGSILANQQNKAAIFEAIAQMTAKGIAAGIKMKQYGNNAQQIAQAQAAITEETTDMMIELCEANPQDPACLTPGGRTSSSGTFGMGEFGFGGDGANNVFGVTPEGSEFGEVGADTNLDDKNSVAGINSPFKDEAKKAKDILNPAAAAQTQAQGGAAGGGAGGGGAGGGGGGGASLGSDLAGKDPDGDKEAQIKAGKVSGSYSAAGGGGYRGIARGKDDANPFSSLFDQKGGGVEEDRSIASGDIDGKASGLFEKISKRYGQVQADKRVEAKNLE